MLFFSLSVYFTTAIIAIGILSYLQDIKENFTSNQCLFDVSSSVKKSRCHLKNLHIWDHHLSFPLEAKCAVQTLSCTLSPAEYLFLSKMDIFLHMALLFLSASSHLHIFSSEEWFLFFTLLIRNLYFLQFYMQYLSHKNVHDYLSLHYLATCECIWLWTAPSSPNMCQHLICRL